MTNQIDTSTAPYHDDYDESKKFIKILFRPGLSIQAREMNQLQTMYQKQISRFADHIFKNGSMVIPGTIVPDFNYRYLKITSNFADGAQEDLNTSLKNYVGKRLKSKTGTLKALIRNSVSATGTDPATLYIDYLNQGGANNDTIDFSANEVLEILDTDDSVIREIKVAATAPVGQGTAVHIKEGVYYVNDYFHLVLDQTLILSKYSNTPSASVGFAVEDDIIDSTEDASLLDNAVGSSNENAPGADRYKSELVLVSKTLDSTGTSLGPNETGDYVQLLRINNGEVENIARTASYSIIQHTLAERSDETNGPFIIDPFTLSFQEHLNQNNNSGRLSAANGGDFNKFFYVLDKGEAYIKGYNVEKSRSTYIETDKARTGDHIKTKNNTTIPCDLGQYVLGTLSTADDGLPSLVDYPEIDIFDNSSSPVKIGTCRIRAVRPDSGNTYRFYIFKVNMNTGKTFIEDAKSLRYTDATYANFNAVLEQSNSKAIIYDSEFSAAVFDIGFAPIRNITDVSYTTTETFDADASGGTPTFSISTGVTNRVLLNNSNIIIVNLSTGVVLSSGDYSLTFSTGNTQLTVGGSGIVASNRYRIFIDVQNTSVSDSTTFRLRTKTTQTKSLTAIPSANEISLTVADAYNITVTDANGNDVSYKYRLDTGQRDGFYDIAKIVLVAGQTQSGNLDIEVSYFSHSDGDYFAANSYSEQDYEKIQFFEASNGQLLDLTNSLDFRPTISPDGTFSGAGSVSGKNISPNSLFSGDIEYYVGRYDSIVLSYDGRFKVLRGNPDDNPTAPTDFESGIILHTVKVPPYTYDLLQVRAKSLEYRRFRMKDIANLQKRIENVEYYTALNLLEKNTQDLEIKDANGNEKFKNGFLVDNFSNQSSGDYNNIGYRFSVDINYGEGHPEVSTKNVMFDDVAARSSNIKVHDNGVVTLAYNEINWASQTQATGDILVNPYAMYIWTGELKLTPESDIWFSNEFAPDIVVDGGVVDNTNSQGGTGTVWNNWQTVWSGTEVAGRSIETDRVREWRGGSEARSLEIHRANIRRRNEGLDATLGRVRLVARTQETIATRTTTQQVRTGIQSFISTSVQTRVANNRVIARAVIPFIRSRRINFVATRLKPESKHWVFFDGIDVSEYSAQTGPDTTRAKGAYLVTNAKGQVNGYFDIPNNASLRFPAGTRTLELYNAEDVDSEDGDSSCDANYHAEGTLETRQRTIVSTRVRSIRNRIIRDTRTRTETGATTRVLDRTNITGWKDPLAQSFLTDKEGGIFLTSIEVAFTEKDDSIPVTLQVRNMQNGFPGSEVLPFGEVVLYPEDITADPNGVTWTKFTFDAPIFIQESVEYCYVLVSNSNTYKVRIARMSEKDITSGAYVSKQPYMGVFFKSQNGTTWTEDQDADMSFKINRAEFTSLSGTLAAVPFVPSYEDGFEADPFLTRMYENPFEALSGSQSLKVFHQNHGMVSGNSVTYTVPDTTTTVFGGINIQNNIDGRTFTVNKVINPDEYYISLSDQSITANDSGRFGGFDIYATSNVAYDILQMNAQSIMPTNTNLRAKIKTTPEGTIGNRTIDSAFSNIELNQNTYFNSAKSLMPAQDDFELEIDLSAENTWLSPVVDLERVSGYFSSNRINNIEDNTENGDYDNWVTYISDSEDLSSSFAKYVSKTVSLINPANSLHVLLDANRRFGSDIEIWYKAISSESTDSIDDVSWTQLDKKSYPSISPSVGVFKEYEFFAEDLKDFTTFKVKIVLKSSNTASSPTLQNFRAIATTS